MDKREGLYGFHDERDWFLDRRFGLFIHWGLYALGEWHEQEMWRKHVSRETYRNYMTQFQPHKFDPDQWIDFAQEAGMEYVTFTAKHCDGFCLWNTQQTAYNIMNTPYQQDILRQLAQACQRRNFPLCVYYSVVDWHQPHYPHQGRAHEFAEPFPGDEPDLAKYVEFVREQIREICSNYGEIHGIWWDANRLGIEDPSINQMIRKLQPKAVINNRGFDRGDYGTPERDFQAAHHGGAVVGRRYGSLTEACNAIGMLSWGYRDHEDHYSSKYLIQSIAKAMAMGGNYLLNVGPRPDGTFSPDDIEMLRKIGRWYSRVQEAYGQTIPASELILNEDVYITRAGNTLYVHFIADPKGRAVELRGIPLTPREAVLLNNGQVLTTTRDRGARHWKQPLHDLRIRDIPVESYYDQVMVIRLEFDECIAFSTSSLEHAQTSSSSAHRNPDIP
jgi:alpha-L-fucosidase